MRSGHITGSKNLPFGELIDANGCLKSDAELAKIFESKGIDPKKPTVNSCGSGVTACILDLGLSVMGGQKSAIYDGSWTEYVSYPTFMSHFIVRVKSMNQTLTSGLPPLRTDVF